MNNLKNVVVLKNLPSNVIEEAIVIVKDSKLAKEINLSDKNANSLKNYKCKKNSVIEEAEMVICEYINKLEKEKNKKSIDKRYNKMKLITCVLSCISVIAIMCNFI